VELPPGVLDVVTGDRVTGAALVAHPTPQMVSIGGFKSSGHGKGLSMYGFEDCTRVKHLMARIS
jgi:betaine-aldehyde dehydrogenase